MQQKSSTIPTYTTRNMPAVEMIYRGESIMQIRGVVTGRVYQFSPIAPIQPIDRRDAAFISQTRLLRAVSNR
jgi:hypothetical protein